jgi:hypothetical protein
MAVSYEVYLQAERMPDAGWVESATRGMEPSFAFAGAYDLVTDSGWCPCRLGATDCGFEWALEPAHDVPADIAAAGFDRVAQLSFRSSDADAICAVLVAANLAMIAGGTIVTPDEERVPADDVLAWASAQVRHLKKGPKGRRRNKVRDKRAPAELLRDWLIDLTAAAATVHGVVRSTPDDPLVAIKFSQGAILKARAWAVSSADGQTLSTAAMPRDMTPAEIGELDHAFDRLVTTLRSGPLTAATYVARNHAHMDRALGTSARGRTDLRRHRRANADCRTVLSPTTRGPSRELTASSLP